ncbi:MAG: two pore domain potassium channel family protein, partial [Bacillus sp. (in: Bacteria)]|nr:two pore domain potassium channel family protein [Bacillus sp. (in: firmicutes)]
MKKVFFIYEILMLILVIISIFFAFSADERFVLFDRIIWLIFVLDYSIRLIRSENTWIYMKKQPLELFAIIPFDSFFRA